MLSCFCFCADTLKVAHKKHKLIKYLYMCGFNVVDVFVVDNNGVRKMCCGAYSEYLVCNYAATFERDKILIVVVVMEV